MVGRLLEEMNFARTRLLPRQRFRFRNRKTPGRPAAEIVFTTAGVTTTAAQKRAEEEGDAAVQAVDPSKCFAHETGKVLVKRAGEIGGADFVLSDLTDCTVFLLDTASALRGDRLTRVRVYAAPLQGGSVLLEHATDCEFHLAAQQLRIHSATRCDFYLRVRSGPIIEHSSACRFAPNDDPLNEGADTGAWERVEDFNWLRAQHSPNWCILPPSERRPPPPPPPAS